MKFLRKNILYTLLVLIIGCNNVKDEFNIIRFEKIKEIKLPLDDPGKNIPYSSQYTIIDSIETMIVYLNNQKLTFYNLNTKQKYHQIKLGVRQLSGFKYINKDSIFIWYVNQFTKHNYLDSLLFLINYNGEYIKSYSFAGTTPVWCSGNMPLSKKSALYPDLYFQQLDYYNNKTFFPLFKWKSYTVGTDSFCNAKTNILSYYDYQKEKLVSSNKLWYPYIEKGIYYPKEFKYIFYCRSSNNKILIRFGYSSDVFEWDYNKDIIKKHTIKSVLIDTILPCKTEPDYYDNDLDAMYSNISYDPYREYYYSQISYNYEKYGLWQLVITDKNFKYIGETELNTGIKTSMPIFTKDYIIAVTMGKRNYLNVSYYKINIIEANKEEFIKSMQDTLDSKINEQIQKVCEITGDTANPDARNVVKYFENRAQIKDSLYAVISMYISDGCHGCRDYLLELIGNNRTTFDKIPFYLVISATNKELMNKLLRKNNLTTFRHLRIDTLKEYKLFDPFGLKNPRLTLVKNKKIVSDTVYFPDNIPKTLIPRLLDFLDLKYKN